ncbi:MAG: PilZ domain-containing protein [Spirochaetales bacterium]|nr:PilZ domain-containing protein [Spirochaetales bacterium]
MKEKRRFPRLTLKVLVAYSIIIDEKEAPAESRNISIGGICIATRQPLDIGRCVSIQFFLPGKMVRVTGRVVRNEEIVSGLYDNGIEFTDIKPEDVKRIEDYIQNT